MSRNTWSTNMVATDDRFDFWSDAICEAILNVEARRPMGDGFEAEISCNRLDLGNFARFRSVSHDIVRSRRMLSQRPDDRYLVSFQISGRCHIEQENGQLTLEPGDVGIVTAARPMHLRFEGDVDRIVAVLPRQMLEKECGWLSPNRPLRFSGGVATTRVLCRILEELAGPQDLDAAGQESLGAAFFRLLASSAGGDERSEHAAVNLERLTAFLARNLADPDLSPRKAARELGMSERTVHGLFAGTGSTFGKWVLNARLDRAAAALRSREWAGRSVTEIAFRLGFNDLSHFSRRFAERFGCAPRGYRAARDN